MNRPAPMTPAMEIIVMCRGLRPELRGEAVAWVSTSRWETVTCVLSSSWEGIRTLWPP
jgi:hypothetical protein